MLEEVGLTEILRHHGLICFGEDFARALRVTEAVEATARVHGHALGAKGGRGRERVPQEPIPVMRKQFLATDGEG